MRGHVVAALMSVYPDRDAAAEPWRGWQPASRLITSIRPPQHGQAGEHLSRRRIDLDFLLGPRRDQTQELTVPRDCLARFALANKP